MSLSFKRTGMFAQTKRSGFAAGSALAVAVFLLSACQNPVIDQSTVSFSRALSGTPILYFSDSAVSGVSPAGSSMPQTKSGTTGWQPTAALTGTSRYWYSSVESGTLQAGAWKIVLWTNNPGSSTVKVELALTNSAGGARTVLGSSSIDVGSSGGGNHPTTYTFNLGQQTLGSQRIQVAVTKTAGADATIAFNGNDFPSRLEYPAVTSASPSPSAAPSTAPSTGPSPSIPPVTYTPIPNIVQVALKNNSNGRWADSQIYVAVIGRNPQTQIFSWLKPDGTMVQASDADNDAAGHLSKNGINYSNYFFTLAQSKALKIPKMDSGRIFIGQGSPLYIKINRDVNGNIGFAGPNVLNPTDPNIDVYFDWYEFTYNNSGIWINTTQVDQFGFPLMLEVYGSNKTWYKKVGIAETRDSIYNSFRSSLPAEFRSLADSSYRIIAPGKGSFDTGKANANYFQSYVDSIWNYYKTHTLTINMWDNTRRFTATVQGEAMVFTEVNLGNGAYQGAQPYYISRRPTTQEILEGKGVLAAGNATELAIEAQVCAAFNRHIMDNGANWQNPATFYTAAPANYFAKFWHDHSVGKLAYGFAYDDVSEQSSTVHATAPEYAIFGIGW